MLLLTLHQAVTGAITVSGETDPPDAGELTPASTVHIGGRTTDGSLTIDQGSALISKDVVIGSGVGVHGSATVTGPGSFWGIQDWLSVGQTSSGELTIADGGIVSVGRSTSVEANSPAAGTIRFDNGTLITSSLFGSLNNLTGTGTIYTNGLIAEGVDVYARPPHFPAEVLQINQNPDQDITVYFSPDERGILGAGFNSIGSVTIDDYHTVDSRYGFIGYHQGSVGTVTARGDWNIHQSLEVGRRGLGILRIEEGATVTVQRSTSVGRVFNEDSAIVFNGGELITGTFVALPSQLRGHGTIHTQGLYADGFDLVFDAQHGTTQTIRLNSQPDQDIKIHLDHDKNSTLGAGYKGNGTLTIRDGVQVESLGGNLGYYGGSSGTADVSGEGTRWRVHGYLDVGRTSDGELTVRDNALVMADFVSGSSEDIPANKSFINLASGGMLAVRGGRYLSEATLIEFYNHVLYMEDPLWGFLRYWDAELGSWSDLANATFREDYTIEYSDTGELAGYTVLTVHTAPEPGTLLLMSFGYAACYKGLRRV